VGLAGRASWFRQGNIKSLQETDAAYRDGIFWGDRDAREGRKLQPSMARWNDEKDRASFKTGYEKGYRQALDSRSLQRRRDRKSTRLNSSHVAISYAVFCLKK